LTPSSCLRKAWKCNTKLFFLPKERGQMLPLFFSLSLP
jgi:hypothetical protein